MIAADGSLLRLFLVIDDKRGEERGLKLDLDAQFLPLVDLSKTDWSERPVGRSDRSEVVF